MAWYADAYCRCNGWAMVLPGGGACYSTVEYNGVRPRLPNTWTSSQGSESARAA